MCALELEDTGVPFLPDGPRGEKCESSHRLLVWNGRVAKNCPPIFDGTRRVPVGSVDAFKLKPFLDHAPEPHGVSALEHEMLNGFLLALA